MGNLDKLVENKQLEKEILNGINENFLIKKGGPLLDHLLTLNNYAATFSAMLNTLLIPAQKRLDLSVCRTALKSDQVKAVEIHHLAPRRDKVLHEFLLRIITSIDFS